MLYMKKAQNLATYILLLTGVVLAITSMQTYVKRGLQARVKDLSDTFIAAEGDHLTTWDSNYFTASNKSSQTENTVKQHFLDGGAKRYETDVTVVASQHIETEDPTKVINGSRNGNGGSSYGGVEYNNPNN